MSQTPSGAPKRIEMSPHLHATLQRATGYARQQLHRYITVEHVLLALNEDPDAGLMLAACEIDQARLSSDVSGFLGHITDRFEANEAGEPVMDAEASRIINSAVAASQRSRRREVNGAIVLAAIIGDGRSAAANMLRAQGLTFEAAIKALQQAPVPSPQVGNAPQTPPAAAAPPPPEPPRARPPSDTEAILADARRRVDASRRGGASPSGAGAPPPPAEDQWGARLPEHPGELAPPRPPDNGVHRPPSAEPAAHARGELGEDGTEDDATTNPARRLRERLRARAEAGAAPYHDTGSPQSREVQAAPPPPPPARPAPAHGPGAGGAPPPPLPAQNGRDLGTVGHAWPNATTGPPPQPSPAKATAARQPRPTQEDLAQQARRAAQDAAAQGSAAPRRTRSGGGAVAGQLMENFPRRMRAWVPVVAEVRVARAEIANLGAGMAGEGSAYRHDIAVTKAMSVRLRAPEGGFFIETGSPETQWIENHLGILSDDFASWRWTITPRRTGAARLQLVVSARTVGSDGMAAETALPDQIINVTVAVNYRRSVQRWGGWIVAAAFGGLLARFGEQVWDTAQAILRGLV